MAPCGDRRSELWRRSARQPPGDVKRKSGATARADRVYNPAAGRMKSLKLCAVLAGYLFMMVSLTHSQAAPNVDWPVAAGNPGGTRYSALKQINASNVRQLQVAWTYDVSDAPGTLETNPIIVNGVLYGYTTS